MPLSGVNPPFRAPRQNEKEARTQWSEPPRIARAETRLLVRGRDVTTGRWIRRGRYDPEEVVPSCLIHRGTDVTEHTDVSLGDRVPLGLIVVPGATAQRIKMNRRFAIRLEDAVIVR